MISRTSACERTSPAAAPNSVGSPLTSVSNATSRSGPSTWSTMPARSKWIPGNGSRVVRATVLSMHERDDIDIDQDGEIGGDDLQQMLEACRLQHRQRGFVHPALAGEVAAA